jgi:Ca-activated chloride channel family protein
MPGDIRELGTAFYDALYYATRERLAQSASGRRVLLMFSDGEDNSSAHHMMDVIEAAQAADVRIYAFRYTESRRGILTARNKYGMRVMERIARETGGVDYDAQKEDVQALFRKLGEELRATYELAYQSSNPVRDESFRKIAIRVKRPDLKVRSKTGYFARP